MTVVTEWTNMAKQAQFARTMSHFFRELDEFVYLAARVRGAFMNSADGRFLSLGDPLADLLDWATTIGERLLKRIHLFTPDYLPVLPLYRASRPWNRTLVSLSKQVSLLAAKSILVSGQFVGDLNLGLLELPNVYEDDRLLFQTNTAEGDALALSCYYAILIRNGVDHFPIPLQDFAFLRFESYPAAKGMRGVLVTDTRNAQTLIQGTVPVLVDATGEEVSLADLFAEAASLLNQVHTIIRWAIAHQEELFCTFILLNTLTERLENPRQLTGPDEFEVIDEKPDEEFEVVADDQDEEFEEVQ